MKRRFLVWTAIILALPFYWTADKMLQKLAVSIASERVVEKASDQEFWVRKFNLKTPLVKQEEVYFDEDSRLDWNFVTRQISGALGGVPFEHEVVLILRAKNGKRTWLKYHLDLCGEVYCPFSKDKFIPTREYSKEEMREEWVSKLEEIHVLAYDLIVVYEVGLTGLGKVRGTNLEILDSARNPVDRFLRDLSSDGPPDFWQTGWQAPEDLLLKTIPER